MEGRERAVDEEARAPGRSSRRPLRRIAVLAALTPLIVLVLIVTLALVYRVVTPPSTLMLGRWLTGAPVQRVVVPLEAIAPSLVLAVLAGEDQRFCRHGGIDWGALRAVADEAGGPSRGASTITMQTVKNVFLWNGRSYLRKAVEIPLALAADLVWGKRRVMETYLNVAEWGDGVFGAEAAARRWFGKSASRLSDRDAALLAAILPNPLVRRADKPSGAVRARASRLQRQLPAMRDLARCLAD